MEEHTIDELRRLALPIDEISQMNLQQQIFAVVWVDISDRPDLAILASTEQGEESEALCTWWYAHPGKDTMQIGLRIEVQQPAHMIIQLAFKVSQYREELELLARHGKLWIVPGPPPIKVSGVVELDQRTFLTRVLDTNGQGLFVGLPEQLIQELRTQLAEWKRIK
ncbi:hypothetical protein KDW_47440 [Dictyobacter vulcani]|uniref:Uncharacterized protein n=1 Tax=Dictyobacter vulcani TaxID=2607529 RepID=A0A5J4KTS4_9CHLR|nr:hypothetical protein [Dictyobacter vulcani]GER90582.1 hypothetical protein KDW_47440 [Dictyobacter vulcani]